MEYSPAKTGQAERYIGLCWLEENTPRDMQPNEAHELKALRDQFNADSDFAALANILEEEKRNQHKGNGTIMR